jgi:hypothetical protein
MRLFACSAARQARRALSTGGRALSTGGRALSTGGASAAREVELLSQVSRLEARVHELEGVLPERVQPRIPKWDELAFAITPTNGHVRHTFSSVTSAWDAGRFVTDPYVNLHIHAGVLHYGMSLFEGCKAFRCKDGKVRAVGWRCGRRGGRGMLRQLDVCSRLGHGLAPASLHAGARVQPT